MELSGGSTKFSYKFIPFFMLLLFSLSSCQPGLSASAAGIRPTPHRTPVLIFQNASFRGEILQVVWENGRVTEVLIKGDQPVEDIYRTARVELLEQTAIFIRDNRQRYRPADPASLEQGQVVEVIFYSGGKEAIPVWADAKEMVILGGEDMFLPVIARVKITIEPGLEEQAAPLPEPQKMFLPSLLR